MLSARVFVSVIRSNRKHAIHITNTVYISTQKQYCNELITLTALALIWNVWAKKKTFFISWKSNYFLFIA